MKNFALICLAVIIFSSCKTDATQEISNTFVQSIPTKEKSDSNFPQIEAQKNFEIMLPLKVREALENAEEFEVLTWKEISNRNFVGKFRLGGFGIVGTKNVKVTNIEIRKQLLDALYQDINMAKDSSSATACFIPHHTIKAKYRGEFIVVAVCFKCGKFLGKTSKTQFGDKVPFKTLKGETDFGGQIVSNNSNQEIKSLPIFERIVAEQNTENK